MGTTAHTHGPLTRESQLAGAMFLVAITAGVVAVVTFAPGPVTGLEVVAVGLFAVSVAAGALASRSSRLPAWRHGAGALAAMASFALLHVEVGPDGPDSLTVAALAWLALFGTRTQVVLGVVVLAVQRLLLPVPDAVVVTGADRAMSVVVTALAAVVALTVSRWSRERDEDADRLRQVGEVHADLVTVSRRVHAGAAGRTELCEAAAACAGVAAAVLLEPDGRGRVRVTAASGYGGHLEMTDTPGSSTVATVLHDGRRRFATHALDLPTTARRPATMIGDGSVLWEPVLVGSDPVGVLMLCWAGPVPRAGTRASLTATMVADEVAALLHRERAVARLTDHAMTDELTGLPNRRVWHQRTAVGLLAPLGGVVVAVVDLDHFKAYNDAHGHGRGDELLVEFARTARAALRSTDVLIRWGGEEFVVLLTGTGPEDAVRTVERVRAAVGHGQTCSAGVAAWDGVEDPASLLARADAALYRAKRDGRDRLCVDEPSTGPRLTGLRPA